MSNHLSWSHSSESISPSSLVQQSPAFSSLLSRVNTKLQYNSSTSTVQYLFSKQEEKQIAKFLKKHYHVNKTTQAKGFGNFSNKDENKDTKPVANNNTPNKETPPSASETTESKQEKPTSNSDAKNESSNNENKESKEDEEKNSEESKNEKTEGQDNKTKLTIGMIVGLTVGSLFVYSLFGGEEPATNAASWEVFIQDIKANNIAKIVVREHSTTIQRKNFQGSYSLGFGGDVFERKLDDLLRELKLTPDKIEMIAPTYYSSSKLVSKEELIGLALRLLGFGIIFFGFTGIGLKSKGGSAGAGSNPFNIMNSTVNKVQSNQIKTKFADVAGLDEAKQEVTEFVDFLKNPEKYSKIGARIPKGALLVGPPGTGKTLLARAVAGESGVPFYSMSGSEFVEMIVGVGPSRVRKLFKEAKENAPSIVFIDEIDAIGRQRGGGNAFSRNDERENTLNQLLVEMDGFQPRSNVVVLAATNRVDILDRALLRPGRFDRQVEIGNPDIKGREQIFKVHLKKLTLAQPLEEYAQRLATLTPGFSGADIANVCNEAALIASRSGSEAINLIHFEEAIDKIIGGLEKKNKVLTPEERNIVAHHEAGHAVAGWFLKYAEPLLKVSIVPRGSGALGYAQYLPKERYIMTMDQIYDMMCVALGGRAAEEIIFGHYSTGASDDLRRVTGMAYSMIMEHGMNPSIGHISFPQNENQVAVEKPFSEQTARLIDTEARKMVNQAYERTVNLLKDHKEHMLLVAKQLLNQEKIGAEDLVSILGERPHSQDINFKEYLEAAQATKAEQKQKEAEKQE